MLKTIYINGSQLDYKICYDNSEHGSYEWTEFYDGAVAVTRRKYWFFGEYITILEPKLVFKIWKNIEDKTYTKLQVRTWIERELELMGREEEIKKGEII